MSCWNDCVNLFSLLSLWGACFSCFATWILFFFHLLSLKIPHAKSSCDAPTLNFHLGWTYISNQEENSTIYSFSKDFKYKKKLVTATVAEVLVCYWKQWNKIHHMMKKETLSVSILVSYLWLSKVYPTFLPQIWQMRFYKIILYSLVSHFIDEVDIMPWQRFSKGSCTQHQCILLENTVRIFLKKNLNTCAHWLA